MKIYRPFITLLFLTFAVLLLPAQNVGLIPSPQQVELQKGTFVWHQPRVAFSPSLSNADFLMELLEDLPEVGVQKSDETNEAEIRFSLVDNLPVTMLKQQAYRVEVTENHIDVQAITEQGLFYGLQSLKQLYRYNYRLDHTEYQRVEIPCMDILDYPALEWRGWMDDISRGPIPTMDFLKKQIRILSEFKLNCFTLYTENTFKSQHYNYAPEDGFSAEEIRELEAYARQYYVELIGSQQCFAHFEKILALPEYAHLADSKWNLDPSNPAAYEFLHTILDEETACYSSPFFNINCDETEQLGSGAAEKYVKKVGAAEAYSRHIVWLHDFLASKKKTTLMWADIVLKDKKIINSLPKDIQMLVWSYAPSDEFRSMIQPVVDAGFDFWVVPGNSMWSTVFPIMSSYEKNIANFARDGYQLGAKGLINTAWNDSGEALLNSSWHAFAWGAEMSWKPIVNNVVEVADEERADRLRVLDTNFNFQFFHFYNNENIIADFLRAVSQYQESPVPELYTMGSLRRFCPWQLFPPLLTEQALADVKEERMSLTFTIQLLQLILSEQAQYENPELIYCAVQATNRMWTDVMLQKFRFDLYHYMRTRNESDYRLIEESCEDLQAWLVKLQEGYNYLRNLEYRPYWQSVTDRYYTRQLVQLYETPQHVFFTTSRAQNGLSLELSTALPNCKIDYWLDGDTTTMKPYSHPILLDHPCVVSVRSGMTVKDLVFDEKKFDVHLGLMAQADCSGGYSTYRPEYSGGGEDALFDGERGSQSYRDGKWQGFQGKDVTLTYRWVHDTLISEVEVSYLHHYTDWILAPQDVEVYTTVNGKEKLVKKLHVKINQVGGDRLGSIVLSGLKLRTDNLKVVVRNPGPLPQGHSGAGYPSYIFLDEILIR